MLAVAGKPFKKTSRTKSIYHVYKQLIDCKPCINTAVCTCLPVLLYDRRMSPVLVWHGTKSGVARKILQTLQTPEFPTALNFESVGIAPRSPPRLRLAFFEHPGQNSVHCRRVLSVFSAQLVCRWLCRNSFQSGPVRSIQVHWRSPSL